jgi:hypothetical protein
METTISNKPEVLTKLDKQAEFIKLRARGLSLRQCGQELGTNKDTCNKWDRELKAQIAKHKSERLQDVYTEYGMYKEARIKALGTALNNIDTELSSRDLSDVSTDKLLDYKLKYTTALSEEYVPIAPQTDEGQVLDAKTIINRLDDLYKRVRDGETTKDQAQTELVVLSGMLRAYDTSELEEKMDKLRRAISV